nr:MAG: hypothetical protein J07AB56_01520 [Candidatus Nanosalinarum sp. J07AB56]
MKRSALSESGAYQDLRELETSPANPQTSSPLWQDGRLGGDALVDAWQTAWKTEVDSVPATPRNFTPFLSTYAKSYLRDEKSSTIRRMLVNDFFQGLRIQEVRGHLPDSLKQLLAELEKDYERNRHTHQHIKHGVDQHL